MKIKKFLFFGLAVLFSYTLNAQPGDPNGGGKPGVPITGIEYLVGLGALFGFRKIMKSFSRKP